MKLRTETIEYRAVCDHVAAEVWHDPAVALDEWGVPFQPCEHGCTPRIETREVTRSPWRPYPEVDR